MISEDQRRALFALREALRLCEGADITIRAFEGDKLLLTVDGNAEIGGSGITSTTVSEVLSWYPEAL